MIKSLEIHNYQSHKHSILEFDKGINVITGTSDSGKSVIIRALKWLATNRPVGDDFKSWWANEVSVTVLVDSLSVQRIKNKKENNYSILNGAQASIFKAMKTDVPDEIKEVLNFTDINFQSQITMPFLLSESSGEVARYLNKIVNLDNIDSTLKNIEKRKRKANSDLNYKEDYLKELSESLEIYDNLDEIEHLISSIESFYNDFKLCSQRFKGISDLISSISETQENIKGYDAVLEAEKSYKEVYGLDKELLHLMTERTQLSIDIDEIKMIEDDIQEHESILGAQNQCYELINYNTELREKESIHAKLELDIDEIKMIENDIENENKELEITQEQYNKLMPDICPLCSQEII